jgi:hypothetical protein
MSGSQKLTVTFYMPKSDYLKLLAKCEKERIAITTAMQEAVDGYVNSPVPVETIGQMLTHISID